MAERAQFFLRLLDRFLVLLRTLALGCLRQLIARRLGVLLLGGLAPLAGLVSARERSSRG